MIVINKKGEGIGVQLAGRVYRVLKKDYPTVFKPYRSRFVTQDTIHSMSYYLFKLIPQSIYVNDPNALSDIRVKVILNSKNHR